MKKAIIVSLILLFGLSQGFSQRSDIVPNLKYLDQKRLRFGFTVGLNTSDFYIRNSDTFLDSSVISEVYSIENAQNPGFHLGPVSNLRLGKYFDLRLLMNLSFTQRNLEYIVLKEDQTGQAYFDSHVMKISSTFLEFPLLLKYKSKRINNYRFYVISGFNGKIDLAAKKKIPDEFMPMIRLKQPDIYGEIGAGIDMYLPYFKFSPEIKMGVGLLNNIVKDNTEYTGAMKYLRSKVFMISFHFEG